MKAIRVQEIDGQEFVPLKDYKILEEENKVVGILNDEIRRINKNLREENQKLKVEKQELEYLGDINEELKEENKKLKDRIAELEKCNLNLQKQIDKQEVRIKELEATNKKRTADNWATFKS